MAKRTSRAGKRAIRQNRPTYRKEVIGHKPNPKNPKFREIKIKGKKYIKI